MHLLLWHSVLFLGFGGLVEVFPLLFSLALFCLVVVNPILVVVNLCDKIRYAVPLSAVATIAHTYIVFLRTRTNVRIFGLFVTQR
jgi:hypothetical protein